MIPPGALSEGMRVLLGGREMSEWRVVSGATRGEALDEAVRVLGVAPPDMEIEDVAEDDAGEKVPQGHVVLRVRVRLDEEGAPAESTPQDEELSESSEEEGAESEGGPRPRGTQTPSEVEIGEQKEVVLDFLADLLEAFDLDGEIAAEHRDGVLSVDINGDDLGSLIGRRGVTLTSLAEITKTVIQRRTASRVRLQLDVQGYRARRRAALQKYARELAQDVLDQGGEKALEAMPAADRKVVHDAVAEVDGVRSYSEGADPKRYVVISPE